MKITYLLCCLYLFVAQVFGGGCGSYDNSATEVWWWTQCLLAYPGATTCPSSYSYQGLTWSFNSAAQLVVTESTGNVVFVAGGGTPAPCDASNQCSLSFQNDGNLVIYTAYGAVWASNTYNGLGAWVKYQTTPPYMSVVSGSCETVWPSASTGSPTTNNPRTTPVLGEVNPATVSVTSTSLPASAWKAQFGVNSHISQGWSSSMVLQLATYLGVGAIRDSIPSGAPGSAEYNDYLSMNAAGIKLNVVVGGTSDISGIQSQVDGWATFQSATGMIQSIEGFNEINNFQFTYNGVNPSTSYTGMYQAQSDLYSTVKANSVLSSLPVYDFTGQCFAPSSDNLDCADITGRADKTNLHIYTNNGEPLVGLGDTNNYLIRGLADGYGDEWTSVSNNVITETGWHTDSVTETATAKLHVNELLNAIQYGNLKTFIYEMIDEVWAGYEGPESHFGLFHNNQTTKPSARALHFISSLLSDTGAGATSSLTFSLSGAPYTVQTLLFENSNNIYYLAVWNNLPVYNTTSGADVANPAVPVTLTLPWSAIVSVYDVFSTTADDTQPLPPVSAATSTSVSFDLADEPVFIAISQCTGDNYIIPQNAGANYLVSENCQYALTIRSTDGAFVITQGTTVIYTVSLWGNAPGPYSLVMQGDGNLVLYCGNGAIWASATGWSGYGYTGPGPFTAQLGNDGIFRVIDSTTAYVLWSSA